MKISDLKLTQLSKAELIARQLNMLRGGTNGYSTCNCGCAYNAIADNREANSKYGYQKSAGDDVYTTTCDCAAINKPMAGVRSGDDIF